MQYCYYSVEFKKKKDDSPYKDDSKKKSKSSSSASSGPKLDATKYVFILMKKSYETHFNLFLLKLK